MSEPNNDKERNRLAKAKLALSGEETKQNWQKDVDYLAKRKQEAAKALASQEQIKALEDIVKEKNQKIETQKKLAQLEELRIQAEKEKRLNLSKEQATKDAEAEAERQRKIKQIIESEQEINFIKKDDSVSPAPIKTLTRDTSLAIKEGRLSASKIILDRETPDNSQKAQLKTKRDYSWLIGLGILLVVIGLIITIVALNQRRANSLADIAQTRTSLIFIENQNPLDLNQKTAEEARLSLSQGLINRGAKESLTEIYFIKDVELDTEKGLEIKKTELNLIDSLPLLGINAPDNFTRFLEKRGLLGLHNGLIVSPFYIFKTTSYKNVANALLEQENFIVSELLAPFSETTKTNEIISLKFQDKMIRNYDTRIITNTSNEVIALYAWFDEGTLIITSNETTFGKILDTLQNPQ